MELLKLYLLTTVMENNIETYKVTHTHTHECMHTYIHIKPACIDGDPYRTLIFNFFLVQIEIQCKSNSLGFVFLFLKWNNNSTSL